MRPIADLKDFCLRKGARPITFQASPGEAWAVIGPANAGKSAFVAKLATGRTTREPGRRSTPQSIATEASGRNATRATEALNACGLWDVRKQLVSKLGAGHLAAVRLIEPLSTPHSLIALDGELDALDPWVLPHCLDLLRHRAGQGAAIVGVTARCDIAESFGHLIVLSGGNATYMGTVEHLLTRLEPTELEIRAENCELALQVAKPFGLRIIESGESLRFEAENGHETAAKLLLAGYGNIRSVIVRRKRLEDALANLLAAK